MAPGFIETRLTAAKGEGSDLGIPEAMRQMSLAIIALGRLGQPEDIANVHAFLVSSDADFISGVTIPVTGGQLAEWDVALNPDVVGRSYPPSEPYEVGREKIREFADAIGDFATRPTATRPRHARSATPT